MMRRETARFALLSLTLWCGCGVKAARECCIPYPALTENEKNDVHACVLFFTMLRQLGAGGAALLPCRSLCFPPVLPSCGCSLAVPLDPRLLPRLCTTTRFYIIPDSSARPPTTKRGEVLVLHGELRVRFL